MTINFLTPFINEKKLDSFTPIVNFAEAYLNIGTDCYKFISMRADRTIIVVNSKLPRHYCHHIALKIASFVLSFGIFPLIMLIIKSLYRFYHPLFIDRPNHQLVKDSPQSKIQIFSNQPKEILQKIFNEFLHSPSSRLHLQYNVLSKHFNKLVNHDFMKWKEIYEKMTGNLRKVELDRFEMRIKMLHTNHLEPSLKQKIQYLCQELWEDAKQIVDVQKIIQDEKLTMGDLMEKQQYDRFKAIVQPIRNKNLIEFAAKLSQQKSSFESLRNLQACQNFINENQKEKADLIRDWFDSNKSELTSVTKINLTHSITMLSTEIVSYMAQTPNLQELDLYQNKLLSLPRTIGNLNKIHLLELSSNQLSVLPSSIGNLNRLQILHLNNNQLYTLPDSIENLTLLEDLLVANNQLTILPNSICNLKQLKIFDLMNNHVSTLPTTIGNLSQLRIIDLTNNPLSTLPDSIENLRQLKKIYIDPKQQILINTYQQKLPANILLSVQT